jgi:hypothetical protein
LKGWEKEWFPPHHRFYIAEDQLYDGRAVESDVAKDYYRYSRRDIQFVDVYFVLPRVCGLIICMIVLIRCITLGVALAPEYLPFGPK